MTFNLLHEPWIAVRDNDGNESETSILDFFENAQSFSTIRGDQEIQEVAITRLLLAIMYRALRPDTEDQWFELYEQYADGDWSAISRRVRDYLSEYEHRFDLLHPTEPFMQVVEKFQWKDDRNPTVAWIDVELHSSTSTAHGEQIFFTSRVRPESRSFSYAEAARALVTFHQYRSGGRQRAVLSEDGSKVFEWYAQAAHSGNGTIYIIKGADAAETLLLNLVPYSHISQAVSAKKDSAFWERKHFALSQEYARGTTPKKIAEARKEIIDFVDEKKDTKDEPTEPELAADGTKVKKPTKAALKKKLASYYRSSPFGTADLYTTQFGRVRLIERDGRIVDSIVYAGERYDFEPILFEPMMSFSKSSSNAPAERDKRFPVKQAQKGQVLTPFWMTIASTLEFMTQDSPRGFIARNIVFAGAQQAYTESTITADSFTFLFGGGDYRTSPAGGETNRFAIPRRVISEPQLALRAASAFTLARNFVANTANLYLNVDAASGLKRRWDKKGEVTISGLKTKAMRRVSFDISNSIIHWLGQDIDEGDDGSAWLQSWRDEIVRLSKTYIQDVQAHHVSQRSIKGHLDIHNPNDKEPTIFTIFDAIGKYTGAINRSIKNKEETHDE